MIYLSIVIPVFNEEKRLFTAIAALDALFEQHTVNDFEVIFVDDGSTDGTKTLVERIKKPYRIRVISYQPNRGKGFAVRMGMLAAQGRYRLLCDVDMSTPLDEVSKFLPLMRQRVDVIIGSRKIEGARVVKHQSWPRMKMGEAYTFLARLITGVAVSDFTCGFKCFSRAAVTKIFSESIIERWSYDAEILFLARKNGFAIHEMPIIWRNDENTRVRLQKDALTAFWDLLRIRFWRGKQ